VSTATATLVTRQPIYDDHGEVVGFELLAGGGDAPALDDRFSARAIVEGVLSGVLDGLAGGSRLVVSISAEALIGQVGGLLPAASTAVKLPAGTPVGDDLLGALADLRRRGAKVILSGFVPGDPRADLLVETDVVGVDLGEGRHRGPLVRPGHVAGRPLLGERIDGAEAFDVARDLGCAWYQGAVFVGSAVVERSAPPGFRPVHVALLEAVSRPEIDVAELERLTKQDVQLTHGLLRLVNSAAFSFRRRIGSLAHAFVLLGERQVRTWATLVVLADLASDQPQQLAVTAGVRARFCERLGAQAGVPAAPLELFALGMFSLIDVLVGRPMTEALAELPLGARVKEALLGDDNALRPVLDAVLAYEAGAWDELGAALDRLGVDDGQLLEHYLAAVDFAAATFDRAEVE
jgi:c-di-GMP-related signal transduction protein